MNFELTLACVEVVLLPNMRMTVTASSDPSVFEAIAQTRNRQAAEEFEQYMKDKMEEMIQPVNDGEILKHLLKALGIDGADKMSSVKVDMNELRKQLNADN